MRRLHSTPLRIALMLFVCTTACGSDPLSDHIERGLALLDDGDSAGAVSAFSAAIEIAPDEVDLYVLRGIARIEEGKYRDAVRDLADALEIDGWAVAAYRHRARAYELLGDNIAAEADYSDAIRITPEDLDLYAARAALYLERGDESSAEADLTIAALTDAIADAAEDGGADADGLRLERANLLLEKGEVALALPDLTLLVDHAPEDASLRLSLASVQSALGDDDDALESYSRALALGLAPEAAREAHLGRAAVLDGVGTARADFDAARAIPPPNADALLQSAWFLATTSDPSQRDGELAVELATEACGMPVTRDWICAHTLAAAHAEAGNLERAIDRQQQALRTAPDDVVAALHERLTRYRAAQ